jgi:hypothetical protein
VVVDITRIATGTSTIFPSFLVSRVVRAKV